MAGILEKEPLFHIRPAYRIRAGGFVQASS